MIRLKRRQRANIALILMASLTLLAFTFRLYQLGAHSLWYDELLQLDIAQAPLAQIGPELPRHAAMPLDYYLLHGWIKLGREESWVRFPAVFFGTLAIPLVYALGWRLFNRQTGILAAALLAWDSFAVSYSQEARPYALLLFFTLITFLGLWQVYQKHQLRYWGIVLAGLGGAALSHYFALFLLAPVGLFVAVQQLYHLHSRRYWSYTFLFLQCLVVLGLIFILNGRVGVLYSVGQRFTRESTQVEAYIRPAEEKPNRGSGPPLELQFFRNSVLFPLATSEPLPLLLYNLLFLVAVLSLLHGRSNRAILMLLAWLILPIGLVYAFLLHRGTFFAIRYILYTLPAYLLLVAYGLNQLLSWFAGLDMRFRNRAHPPLRYLLTLVLLGLLLNPLLLTQTRQLLFHYHSPSREDWRAVGQLLRDNAQPGDLVVAVRAEPTMNWYYPPAARPFGTYNRSQPVWEALNRHPRRWFILSSYSFKRDQALRDWLQRQQAVLIPMDRRVLVYFHQEGQSAAEILAQVKEFTLPQKVLTYQILAHQFEEQGDLETSQAFYHRAEALSKGPASSQVEDAEPLGALDRSSRPALFARRLLAADTPAPILGN